MFWDPQMKYIYIHHLIGDTLNTGGYLKKPI